MPEKFQPSPEAIRALHDPVITAKAAAELLNTSPNVIRSLTDARVITPHDIHSSRVSRYSQRMYTLAMVMRAWQALALREQTQSRVVWRTISYSLAGLPGKHLFQSEKWLAFLRRVKSQGYNGAALPRWKEIQK